MNDTSERQPDDETRAAYERLARANEHLRRNPVRLNMDPTVPEISGFPEEGGT